MKTPARKTASKRKPTPAQLAARERFAEMARARGRKSNPDGMGSYGPFYGDTDSPMTEAQIERKVESYMDRLDRQLMRNEITQTVYDREVKALDKWAKGQYAKRRKTNPAKAGAVKMKIRGSETPDNPDGLIVTEAGALRWAKQNMPKDLKRAGFVPSVVAGTRGWSINYGAAVPGHSTYSRNPAEAGKVRRNPAARKWLVVPRIGKYYIEGSFSTEQAAKDYLRTLNAPWNYKVKRAVAERAPRRASNPVMAPSTVYQVQHSKDGKAWEVWGTYDTAEKARVIAKGGSDSIYPGMWWRVESIKVKA